MYKLSNCRNHGVSKLFLLNHVAVHCMVVTVVFVHTNIYVLCTSCLSLIIYAMLSDVNPPLPVPVPVQVGPTEIRYSIAWTILVLVI